MNFPEAVIKPGSENFPEAVIKPGNENFPEAIIKPGSENFPEAVIESIMRTPAKMCNTLRGLLLRQAPQYRCVTDYDAAAGEADNVGVFPLLEHTGDHLAGRGNTVGDALMGGC